MQRISRSLWGLIVTALGVLVALSVTSTVWRFAHSIITPPKRREYPVRVLAVDRARSEIRLSADPSVCFPGKLGLWWEGDQAFARLGDIVQLEPESVVRQVDEFVLGVPRPSMKARESGWMFAGPWDLDLNYESVDIATELGPAPAWLIDSPHADPRDWVIHVHGRTAKRAETLRGVVAVSEAGWRSLVISYRNDGEAPSSADGKYTLGADEARDVIEAINWARHEGAERIVLMGWSMGGNAVLRAADLIGVDGVILESPALDWMDVITHHAGLRRLPTAIAWGVRTLLITPYGARLLGLARPIDWNAIDGLGTAVRLNVPVLLLASDDDDFVPSGAAHHLAEASRPFVTARFFDNADHCRIWNAHPDEWNESIRSWLQSEITKPKRR